MGALDELIARDNQRHGGGQLQQLLANDAVRNMPSQDPEIPTEEPPAFIGYDPATAPPKAEEDPYAELRSMVVDIMDPESARSQQAIQGARDWRNKQGGYAGILDNLAEAYVGAALPGAGKGASLLRKAAVEGAEAMGMTAADKANEVMRDESGQPTDLGAMAREVLTSGGFGAAGGALGHYAGRAAGAIKDWAGDAAAKAKNLVSGQGARDAKAIAAAHGVDAIDESGQLLEKYSPSGLTGKSAESHLKVVGPEREAVGEDLRRMAQEVNGQLAPDDLSRARTALQDGLASESARVKDALPEDQVQYGDAIGAIQQRLARKPEFESFPALIGEKSGLQGFGHSGPGGSVPESAQKQAAAYGGSVLKDEVSRIIDQMPPELRDRYIAQNQNFAELSGLEETLRNKAAAEATGGDMGGIIANSVISGGLGAAAGGMAADDKSTGIIGGGAAGFAAGLGLQGGATRTALRQGGGSRLTDAGGNMLRGIERAAGTIDGSESAAALAALGSERWADRQQPQDKPGAQVAIGNKRVAEALRTYPEKLGPFAQMLQGVPPEELPARIRNLADREPMFRRILRELEDAAPTELRPQSGITFSMEGE